MKIYSFVVAALLVASGSALAQDEAAQGHPKEHLDQFMKQCMDANDNQPLCQCAQNAYRKIVPAGAGQMGTHEQYDGPVLQLDDEYLMALAPAIEECETKFAKH